MSQELRYSIIFLAFSAVFFIYNIQSIQTIPVTEDPMTGQEQIAIERPDNILYDSEAGTIRLDSLTLRQKISQMVITYGNEGNKDFIQNTLMGGVYFVSKPTKQDFIDTTAFFQEDAIIPLFISADLEGCWNPFIKFYKSPTLSQIETKEEAYVLGMEHGQILKDAGFNLNFAPVVDLEDNIWECRSFKGTLEEISEKAAYYIRGIEEKGIMSSAKHYPGKTLLTKDPHKHIAYATIEEKDLFPYEYAINGSVSSIMISHIIVQGMVDSEGKPSVASEELVNGLRKTYDGLIITDEIRMLGLADYYEDIDQMYIDVFRADNDIILNFDDDQATLYHMIVVVEDAVNRGEISEERIDSSVTRILEAKGLEVI